MKKIFLAALFCLIILDSSSAAAKSFPRLLYFFSETCHSCQKIKNEVMPGIEKEFFDKIIIERYDIGDPENYRLMLSLKEKYNCLEQGVPAMLMQGRFLVGEEKVKDGLRKTIEEVIEEGKIEEIGKLPGIDLAKRFLSFSVLAIAVAGLIDGINPCAFTVIVFFVSFLALQGYKRRELAAIGFSFILAVFLTYILVGLGIFRFLYSIRHFYLISKTIYYLIALLSFSLAAFAVYDIWIYVKTKRTEGMTLQLPQVIKNRIHSIIGSHYRKTKSSEKGRTQAKKQLLGLIISAFITGFLISLLEAVCTGQLYLPTITFIMKDVSLRLRAWVYLLLYNLMFIIPLLIVLIFALLGTTQEGFSRSFKKHIVAVKLIMAGVFILLGVLLILKA